MDLRVGRACRVADYRGGLGRRAFLLRGEHERARVSARLPGRDRGDTSGRGRAGDPRVGQRVDRRVGGGGAGARGRYRADRAGATGREGRERLAADGTGEGALLPAAERGLGTAARRGGGPARGARSRPGCRRGDAPATRRQRRPLPLRVAIPGGRHVARRGALPAPLDHRAEHRQADPPGRLGAVERADGPPRGGRPDRLHGSRLLRLLRRVRLRQAARRGGLAPSSSSPAPPPSTTTSSPPT